MLELVTMDADLPYDGYCDLETECIIAIESETSDDVIVYKDCYAVYTPVTSKSPARLWYGCTHFEILRRVRDKSQRVYADIVYEDGEKELIKRVPVSMLKGTKLEALTDFGLDVSTDRNITKVLGRYFTKLLNKLEVEDADPPLGFVETDVKGEFTFAGYDQCDADPLLVSDDTYEEYLKGLNALLCDSTPLQFAAVASVGSIMLAYLRLIYQIPVASWTVCFTGTSSTGKSTAQLLGASLVSTPNDKRLMSNFNTTVNAAFRGLRYKGLPVFFEEATAAEHFNHETFVYQISMESDKKRLNTDLSERECGTFITIPVLSSEESFLRSNDRSRLGEAVRLMTFYNLKFTNGREHAEKVHDFCVLHYGHIGRAFVNHIMDSESDFKADYDKHREYLRNLFKSTCSLSERLISEYAIFLLTADILAELGVVMEYDAIAAIIDKHHSTIVRDSDSARIAYEVLVSYAAENPYAQGFRINNAQKTIGFSAELFEKILKQNHFHDSKMIIAAMAKEGYIKRSEPKRVKTRLTFNGVRVWGYVIYMNPSESSQPMKEDEHE